MVTVSKSSHDIRLRDFPATIAAWITRNRREGLRDAERFPPDLVVEKLDSHTAQMRELMDNLVVGMIAVQAEVQS